jgi:hypothetical protein
VALTDDQLLRQRLHEEFGALEVSLPPVLRITGRGRGIRARRRALAAGTAVLAALAVAAAAHFNPKTAGAPTVTLNKPNPAAPGGVFASGTAHGKPWALAVRNIADAGSHRCLAAVMFNGRDGDVLFKVAKGTPSFGNPAFVSGISGFPGIGAMFTQVPPGTTRLVLGFADGMQVSARPVGVRACGTAFNLAGLVFADARRTPTGVATYTRSGLDERLVLNSNAAVWTMFGPSTRGVWVNLDKSRADIAASQAATPIGAGTVTGQAWHIRVSLGLYGQCYTATLRTPGHGRGQGSVCVPVAAPPRIVSLTYLPVSSAQAQLPGYAGLVTPRAATVVVSINNGTSRTVRPVDVAGRAYLAFAVPAGCRPYLLSLYDAAGHRIATSTALPPAKRAGSPPLPAGYP